MRIIHTNGSVLLVMDRTNWKWGQKDINFLFLAFSWEGIAVPLFCLCCLIREIPRQKPSSRLCASLKRNGQEPTIQENLSQLAPASYVTLQGKRSIGSGKERRLYFVSVLKPLVDNDAVVLLSNKNPDATMALYKRRWEIEKLFGCLKSRGFTHITEHERLSALFSILAFTFFGRITSVFGSKILCQLKSKSTSVRSVLTSEKTSIASAQPSPQPNQKTQLLAH
jgi:hypothetical protein